ncbi:MAG TPA: SIS domain-containing protein [Capillimicrobium sp.]|jgi:glucosamine--fructose-6-phosphate aminotransferase (isomerizing)
MSSDLEREIREQPAAVAAALERNAAVAAQVADGLRARGPLEQVVIAARGTSDNAARYAQYLFGARLGVPVALAAPSLTTMYDAPAVPRGAGALVVAISQSGRSPDVVGVLASARAAGAPTLAVTNDPESPLAQAADWVLDLGVGVERSVAATKTYTASLAVVAALVAAIGDDAEARRALDEVPALLERTVDGAFAAVGALDGLREAPHVVTVGRGFNFATALEVALKLRELTAIVAEGFSPPDLLHGPIAAVAAGTPAIVVAPAGRVRASVLEAAEVLRARGARCVLLADDPGADLPLPTGAPEWLTPLFAVVPGQVLALRWTALGGGPIDRPPGLTKVTETL